MVVIIAVYSPCAIIQTTIVIIIASNKQPDTFCNPGAGVWM